MGFTGVTFDNQTATPKNDGRLYRKVLSDGIVTGCALTSSGANLSIAAGGIIICGRYFEFAATETVAISGATSGYAQVKIVIDTTATATAETFAQLSFDVEYSATDSFTALTQDDINAAGTTYEFELCRVTLNAGGIDTIISSATANDTKFAPLPAAARIVTLAASTTFALSDAGTMQLFNSASNLTGTVPTNASVAFPIGTEIEICRYGAGTVTIVGASGVTIACKESTYAISEQYSSAALKKIDTNTWLLVGNVG